MTDSQTFHSHASFISDDPFMPCMAPTFLVYEIKGLLTPHYTHSSRPICDYCCSADCDDVPMDMEHDNHHEEQGEEDAPVVPPQQEQVPQEAGDGNVGREQDGQGNGGGNGEGNGEENGEEEEEEDVVEEEEEENDEEDGPEEEEENGAEIELQGEEILLGQQLLHLVDRVLGPEGGEVDGAIVAAENGANHALNGGEVAALNGQLVAQNGGEVVAQNGGEVAAAENAENGVGDEVAQQGAQNLVIMANDVPEQGGRRRQREENGAAEEGPAHQRRRL